MGLLSDLADTVSERLDLGTIAQEMGAGLDKMAVQGAAEVGQALFTGNAYMPYGPTQAPLEMADTAPAMDTAPAQAPEVQAPVQEAPAEPSQSYEQMLDSYTPPTPPEQQQENAMER